MKELEPKEETLPDEVLWTLQRCDGFLDLHMPARARAEWARIPAAHQSHRAGVEILLRLAMEEQNWAEAADLAEALTKRYPDEPAYPVQLAYCTRRKESIAAARSILLEASRRFKKTAVIPYNLACYECQLGHREEALTYLKRAVKLNAGFIKMALDDEDLEPIWALLDIEENL